MMKLKRVFAVAAAVIATLVVSVAPAPAQKPAPQPRTGRVSTDIAWLNLRAQPSLDALDLGDLAPGSRVDIIDTAGDWHKIALFNADGVGIGSAWVYARYVITAAPPPTPTPTPTTAPRPPPAGPAIGLSMLNSAHLAEPSYRAGVRVFMFMDAFLAATQFKDAHPDAVVMVRRYVRSMPAPTLDLFEGANDPRLLYLSPLNECDVICYGSPSEIARRAAFDRDLARLVRAKGATYLAAGFSMGTPDFTSPDICKAVREHYAPGYNAREFGINAHLYSPTPQWAFGEYSIRELPGADGITRWSVGRNGVIATIGPSTRELVGPQKWFERRWEFLFDPNCGGFNPDPSLIGVYSDELGLDEGGVGGVPAHGLGCDYVERLTRRVMEIQREPLVIAGKRWPSPFRAGAWFQADPGNPNWAGYAVGPCAKEIAAGNR